MGGHYIPASVRLVAGLCAERMGLRSLLTRRLRRKRTVATAQKLPFPCFPFSPYCVCGSFRSICIYYDSSRFALLWLFFALLRTKKGILSQPVFSCLLVIQSDLY